MEFKTKMTSKGTITIAAPIRKALGLKPGQTVKLKLDEKNSCVLMNPGVTVEQFEKIRDEVLSKYPNRPKGLSVNAMRNMATKTWLAEKK